MRPFQTPSQEQLFETVLSELDRLGYSGELTQRSYQFQDWFLPGNPRRIAPAVAFAQTPLAYDSACFVIVVSNGKAGTELVGDYRALGAPRAIEVRPDRVLHWRVSSDPTAKQKPLVIRPEELREAFSRNRESWAPANMLRAKNIGPVGPEQRDLFDFIDFGLVPAIEEQVRAKLMPLLLRTLYEATRDHAERTERAIDPTELFRLVFRVLAGKVMHDRGLSGFKDINPTSDPDELLRRVAAYYNDKQPIPGDRNTQMVVVNNLWSDYSFKNLSAAVLAFVWENALVDEESRDTFGIHATPPSIARYIVRRLPIQEIPQSARRVVEPCCGSGVFLLAALQRLRELLIDPPIPDPRERHNYFRRMLSGFDIEPFGLEVARHCLMLADFPNPNGWHLEETDVFAQPDTTPDFRAALEAANVVLCNPPFGSFSKSERRLYRIQSHSKPVEMLQRVLNVLAPQGVLGFVMPLQLLSGQSYRGVREHLASRYEEIEIVSLPDKVFAVAQHETALLIAKRPRRSRSNMVRLLHRKVADGGWPAFDARYEVEREDAGEKDFCEAAESLAVVDMQAIWQFLATLPTVNDVTDGVVRRGIEWNIPLRNNRTILISSQPKGGYRLGIPSAGRKLYSYQRPPTKYLCVKDEYRRREAFDLPWDRPKVVMNAKRKSRGPWRIAAFADYSGLVCYQTYTALWPSGGNSPTVLAAVLNGPVANAYIAVREATRDIPSDQIKRIPVPLLDRSQVELIETLVAEYLAAAHGAQQATLWEREPRRESRSPDRIIREIDAVILEGYGLPPRMERQLLDYFNGEGHRRPVPFTFADYFPKDFRPCFSLSDYITKEVTLATVEDFRSRYERPSEDVLRAMRRASGIEQEEL